MSCLGTIAIKKHRNLKLEHAALTAVFIKVKFKVKCGEWVHFPMSFLQILIKHIKWDVFSLKDY